MTSPFHTPTLNLTHVLESETEKVGEEFEIISKILLGEFRATLTAGEGGKCVRGLQGRWHSCNRWADRIFFFFFNDDFMLLAEVFNVI